MLLKAILKKNSNLVPTIRGILSTTFLLYIVESFPLNARLVLGSLSLLSRLCRHNVAGTGSATNVVVLAGPGAVVSRHFHGTSRGFLPPLGELWRVSLHDFDYKTQPLDKVAELDYKLFNCHFYEKTFKARLGLTPRFSHKVAAPVVNKYTIAGHVSWLRAQTDRHKIIEISHIVVSCVIKTTSIASFQVSMKTKSALWAY